MTLRELINSVDSEQYSDRSATKGDACLSKNSLYQKLRDIKPEYGSSKHIQEDALLLLLILQLLMLP